MKLFLCKIKWKDSGEEEAVILSDTEYNSHIEILEILDDRILFTGTTKETLLTWVENHKAGTDNGEDFHVMEILEEI